MPFGLKLLYQAMIEEGSWAESAAPACDVDLVGDADDGDVQW